MSYLFGYRICNTYIPIFFCRYGYGRRGHCAVTLHNGKVLILGDYHHKNTRNVLIFDPSNNTFTTGPSLLFDRKWSGCALFNSALHAGRPVVLAAGGKLEGTAEVYDYTNADTWEQSK